MLVVVEGLFCYANSIFVVRGWDEIIDAELSTSECDLEELKDSKMQHIDI